MRIIGAITPLCLIPLSIDWQQTNKFAPLFLFIRVLAKTRGH